MRKRDTLCDEQPNLHVFNALKYAFDVFTLASLLSHPNLSYIVNAVTAFYDCSELVNSGRILFVFALKKEQEYRERMCVEFRSLIH